MYFERIAALVVVFGLVGVGAAVFVAATVVADFAIVVEISSGHDLAKQFVQLVQLVRQAPHAGCDL